MVTSSNIRYSSIPFRWNGRYINVVDQAMARVTNYPIQVMGVSGNFLGTAENPDEFVELWNSDPLSNRAGTLETGVESTRFWIIGSSLTYIMAGINGDFSDDFNNDFFI